MSRFTPVIDSYIRCIEHEDFFDRFYEHFLSSDPSIQEMFQSVDFGLQKTLIRRGLMSILSYLDDGSLAGKVTLRRLKESHGPSGMNINLHQYNLWRDCILKTVKEIDGEYTEQLDKLWKESLDHGIMLMMS